MIKWLRKLLFYGRCEVCCKKKPAINHFHFFLYRGEMYEDVCDDCCEQIIAKNNMTNISCQNCGGTYSQPYSNDGLTFKMGCSVCEQGIIEHRTALVSDNFVWNEDLQLWVEK